MGHTRYLHSSCYSSLVQLLQYLFFMLMLLSWYFKKYFQTVIFPGNTACDHISPLILLFIFQHNLKVASASLNFALAFYFLLEGMVIHVYYVMFLFLETSALLLLRVLFCYVACIHCFLSSVSIPIVHLLVFDSNYFLVFFSLIFTFFVLHCWGSFILLYFCLVVWGFVFSVFWKLWVLLQCTGYPNVSSFEHIVTEFLIS